MSNYGFVASGTTSYSIAATGTSAYGFNASGSAISIDTAVALSAYGFNASGTATMVSNPAAGIANYGFGSTGNTSSVNGAAGVSGYGFSSSGTAPQAILAAGSSAYGLSSSGATQFSITASGQSSYSFSASGAAAIDFNTLGMLFACIQAGPQPFYVNAIPPPNIIGAILMQSGVVAAPSSGAQVFVSAVAAGGAPMGSAGNQVLHHPVNVPPGTTITVTIDANGDVILSQGSTQLLYLQAGAANMSQAWNGIGSNSGIPGFGSGTQQPPAFPAIAVFYWAS
jgi:hypothetical protein